MKKIVNNKYFSNIIIFLLSFMSLLFINSTLKSNHTLFEFSNSIYSLIVFLGVLFLIGKATEKIKREKDVRLLIVSIILGLIFSIFMVAGRNILLLDTLEIGKIKTWIKILCGIPFWTSIIILLMTFQLKSNEIEKCDQSEKISLKKYFFICWGIIFGVWFIGLIASYPGVYGYDCIYQMHYYITRKVLSQHPYIHTYLLGFCTWTIGRLLGSYERGFFIYSIIQMLILSSSFAYICLYLRKRDVNCIFRIVSIVLMAILPCNMIMSFSGTKDIIYAAMVIYLTVMLLDVIEEPEKLDNIKWIIALIVVFFLQSVFRSQGIYITVLILTLLIIFSNKNRKIWAIVFGSVLVLFVIYQGPLAKICHVTKTDSIHEMMSVPCSQIARVYTNPDTKLSSNEKKKIQKYIPNVDSYNQMLTLPDEVYKNYIKYIPNYPQNKEPQGIADGVKNTFNSKAFKKNPKEFIGLWINIGKKYPGIYLDAWTRLSSGNWYPDMNYPDPTTFHPYWEYDMKGHQPGEWVYLQRTASQKFHLITGGLRVISNYNIYQKIPLLSTMMNGAFSVWIMLFFIGQCLYEKKYNYLFPAIVTFLIWLTLLLGPVVQFRYLYPIYVCTPIWIGIMLTLGEEEEDVEI